VLPVIGVSQLSVRYDGTVALDSVTLRFRRGEIAVLVGRSGAGKSTLLRCLNYLQTPSAGKVEVEGIGPLCNARCLRQHRRQTGTVFQHHHLIGRQTVLKNVLAGRLGYHSAVRSLFPLPQRDVDLALECLNHVGLLPKALARADQLSGGEQQRVGIARALCQQPNLILADEPVASLDPATAEEVMTFLCDICRRAQLTLIVSLHQFELARRFGDRIIALAQGKVIFDGPPTALAPQQLHSIYETNKPDAAGPSASLSTSEPDSIRATENTHCDEARSMA
jgi:phosphonate transport system ATP-binding protein